MKKSMKRGSQNLTKKNTFKIWKVGAVIMLIATILMLTCIPAFAAGSELESTMDKTLDIVWKVVTWIGILALIAGGIMFIISFTSHDPSQRVNAIIFFAGGLFAVSLKSILSAIGVPV